MEIVLAAGDHARLTMQLLLVHMSCLNYFIADDFAHASAW